MKKGIATPQQMDEILHRLGTDDAFREHFLGNPVSALAQHGVTVDPKDVPHTRSLPSKDSLMNDLANITAQINSGSMAFFVTTA
jgi:putative modified peptide